MVLHGAETGSRSHRLYEHLADLLPPHGIAVLRYERRGSNVPLRVQADDVDFLVLVAASGVTPAAQMRYGTAEQ